MASKKELLNRRDFLKSSALVTFTASVSPVALKATNKKEANEKNILNFNPKMRYRQLGNTNIYLSVISLGGIGLQIPVAHYAIDQGVNLVHISHKYSNGNSIINLGKVLKEKRDKVYVALKANFDDIDPVLKTLNTDYVDFLMFNRHSVSAVKDPRNIEIFEKYKQQGKVRFAGLTTHRDVKACVNAGLGIDLYCAIMPVLNQPNLEALNQELKIAYERGIGIIAMKTMKGITDPKLETAYLKKVLSNPAVTTVLKGFNTFNMFDSYMKAMQETLSYEEDVALYRYAQVNRSNNCMMCGECERICPEGIEISTALRCKDYYDEQLHDFDTALATYQSIPSDKRISSVCRFCRQCEEVCLNGINIVDRLEAAAGRFSESYT